MAKKLAHISEDHSREQTVYEHLTGTAELAKQFAADAIIKVDTEG